MSHPAYPSLDHLRREAAATTRDAIDLFALAQLRGILATAIAQADRIEPLRHPDIRWNVGDLLAVLQDAMVDLDATAKMIGQGELVLEDAA